MKNSCDNKGGKKEVQALIACGRGFKKETVNGTNRGVVKLVIG